MQPISKPEAGEDLCRAEAPSFICFAVEAQHELYIFLRGQEWDQIVCLERKPDLLTAQPDTTLVGHLSQVLTIDQHLPIRRRKQRGEDGQHRRLARTAG